jgi:hypothetical protein
MEPHLCVGIDVGCKAHRVGIARPDGSILEEFDISHNDVGFQEFFRHVEAHRHQLALAVAAAMERRLRGQALFFDVNSHTPAHARSCPEATRRLGSDLAF